MEIVDAIRQRRSIRAFKTAPVPKEVLREMMELALRAPSWANTQPWEFAIVSGRELEEIRKAFVEKAEAGEPMKPESAAPQGFPEPYDTRRRGVGRRMFDALGLKREDAEKRAAWGRQGMALFGAPCAIYILTGRPFYFQGNELNAWPLFDCGLVAENIMLLAGKYGLGTIPEIQAVAYPDVLRKVLTLPDSTLIVLGIAIGYPDWDSPINRMVTDREALDNVTRWYGFAQR